MTRKLDVDRAHEDAPLMRFALRDLLKTDETKASAEGLALIAGMRAAATPEEFDAHLHSLAMNRLFTRGVLYIGDRR